MISFVIFFRTAIVLFTPAMAITLPLVLANQIIKVGLDFSKLHLIYSLRNVPMHEGLFSEKYVKGLINFLENWPNCITIN